MPDWIEHVSYVQEYPGYAKAVNAIINGVIKLHDPNADWFVTGGDDIFPDKTKSAEEIARECSDRFTGLNWPPRGATEGMSTPWERLRYSGPRNEAEASTFGVMQPTADRWHEGVGGFSNAPIDRVCGSPWMGREFCRRMYGGKGPLFEGYRHMFVDEELQEVALKLGVLWQRRDLTHFHKHWGRGETDKSIVNDPKIPDHLVKWNTPEHWRESKQMFDERKAAGFPGHEPL